MNLFTNKIAPIFWVALLACGCNYALASQPNVQPAQPVENTIPPAQPVAQDLPKPVLPAAPAATPQEAPAADAVSRLKAWDKELRSLQTSFTQVTTYDGVEISRSTGTLFYEKDGPHLRLDTYEKGHVAQSAITDKKDIHILDDKGLPVMQLSWAQWQQNQPNQALFDFGNYTQLLSRHHIKQVRPDYLVLTPKEAATYTLYMTLSPQDYFPQSFKLVYGDMVTQADLTAIQKNKKLPTTTFGGFFK